MSPWVFLPIWVSKGHLQTVGTLLTHQAHSCLKASCICHPLCCKLISQPLNRGGLPLSTWTLYGLAVGRIVLKKASPGEGNEGLLLCVCVRSVLLRRPVSASGTHPRGCAEGLPCWKVGDRPEEAELRQGGVCAVVAEGRRWQSQGSLPTLGTSCVS